MTEMALKCGFEGVFPILPELIIKKESIIYIVFDFAENFFLLICVVEKLSFERNNIYHEIHG